ncbi:MULTISPECIES: hypothetical protein [unclassified Pseudomonas]|uniref:hypothetical protein n=1 Tax=unclassified Pseudomonas TaxID=196821 RepID=UPI002892EF72|nr:MULTISPECIES: hypothetical protein [unclassified Pseudomonas]
MEVTQNYVLNIRDLFTASCGALRGAEVVISVLDDNIEIDRLNFKGKVGPGGDGHSRGYIGKPGLRAEITFGPGTVTLTNLA